MLTAQPSNLDTFLWRLFQLFTLPLECQRRLSADTTSAYLSSFFFPLSLRRSQSCLAFGLRWAGTTLKVKKKNTKKKEPVDREWEENGG